MGTRQERKQNAASEASKEKENEHGDREARPRIGAIKLQLEKGKALIAQVAPKHLTADRMVRLAMLAVSKQPKLAECSGISILKA